MTSQVLRRFPELALCQALRRSLATSVRQRAARSRRQPLPSIGASGKPSQVRETRSVLATAGPDPQAPGTHPSSEGDWASLTAGLLVLDAPTPNTLLEARSSKNRRRTEVPLRSDLTDES